MGDCWILFVLVGVCVMGGVDMSKSKGGKKKMGIRTTECDMCGKRKKSFRSVKEKMKNINNYVNMEEERRIREALREDNPLEMEDEEDE